MTIDKETRAEILHLYHVEKWTVGTITRQLGVHRYTVERLLTAAGEPRDARSPRPSMIDPYVPFIAETLASWPTLPASRLYQMVRERGYPGGGDHFRHLLSHFRPRPVAEAYLRLRTLPGEQAQVDWGHFGKVTIGRAERRLMGFVMVLSYSRRIFLRFYLDAGMSNFLRGHVEAFEAWQGVPRELWYDNLKSVVLERRGAAIRFNPRILDLAGHYHFLPKPVAVARGNEKGRVERAIRYVRTSFFAARRWRDIDDLNAQALAWCHGIAADRPWPEDRSITVRETFERERGSLIALPGDPFPDHDRVEVAIGKTPTPASISTITACRTPMCGAPSSWSRRSTRCASSTVWTSSPAIRGASTRRPASRTPSTSPSWSGARAMPAAFAARTGWSRPRPTASACSPRPPGAAAI